MSSKYQQRQERPKVAQYHSSSQDSESESDSGAPQPQQLINKQMEKIKHQLKSVPYELILKQMNPDKTSNTNKKPANTPKIGKKIKKPIFEKPTKTFKNEAVEISIHSKPVKKTPVIFEPERRKAIDPRFQSYAGNYNQDLAMKTYSFIPELQKAQINELKSKLKNPTKKNKLNPYEKEVLSKQYNQLTNDVKRTQLMLLEKQTKNELKRQHGDNYHLSKKTVKHEFERKKLEGMSEQQRQQKMREQYTKLQRRQLDERRQTLHFKPRR